MLVVSSAGISVEPERLISCEPALVNDACVVELMLVDRARRAARSLRPRWRRRAAPQEKLANCAAASASSNFPASVLWSTITSSGKLTIVPAAAPTELQLVAFSAHPSSVIVSLPFSGAVSSPAPAPPLHSIFSLPTSSTVLPTAAVKVPFACSYFPSGLPFFCSICLQAPSSNSPFFCPKQTPASARYHSYLPLPSACPFDSCGVRHADSP